MVLGPTARSHVGARHISEVGGNSRRGRLGRHGSARQARAGSARSRAACHYRSLYTTTPAWKDVTIVPRMGSVELLMPVLDYAGMAMLHCHIIEHGDIGMMGVWHIMEGME